MYKCECGKEFEMVNSFNGHKSHCKIHMLNKYGTEKGPRKKRNNIGFYRCECGKEFNNQNKWSGHASNCVIHLGQKRYNDIQKIRQQNRIQLNTLWSRNRTKESFEKQSLTRKEKYATGELKPAKGVGRGKYSYIVYNNRKFMLRSTYEFIFCFYLCYFNLPINLEDTKVNAIRQNRWSNTFISDFRIGNTIIEIKGIKSGKDYVAKSSFEAEGYKYKILYKNDIDKIKTYLEHLGFDMDYLLSEITRHHNNKDYFIYTFPITLY